MCVLLLILAILVDGTSLWFYFFPEVEHLFVCSLAICIFLICMLSSLPVFESSFFSDVGNHNTCDIRMLIGMVQ